MSAQAQRNPRLFLFPDLPKAVGYGLTGVFVAAWLAAMTAPMNYGRPVAGMMMMGCPWPLNDHGVITCVSHATYNRAGAADERFVCGILLFFFALHFGVIASEILRRRRDAGGATRKLA
jgi:hypothetical protein